MEEEELMKLKRRYVPEDEIKAIEEFLYRIEMEAEMKEQGIMRCMEWVD